jgi:CheY-like chemotaxis protein/two-component sensor histidine kinase
MSEPLSKDSLRSLDGCMGEDIEKVMTTEVIHDFKNILTGILGNLAIAKDWSNPQDPAYPFIEAAERVTRHANQLAMQLLSSAKGGGQHHHPFSLARLIRDSVDLILGGSKCVGQTSISPDLRLVEGDEARIAQVLNNLLENARQAMPNGGTITVSASNLRIQSESKFQIKPGKYILVSVEDQGIGIPEELLTKIFRMHFTTKKDGNGIGLASCVYIIRNHGGTIHVESEVGKGSVFSVLIPCTDLPDTDAVPRRSSFSRGSGRILVMDDELMVQQIVCEMLEHFGYEVQITHDGQSAVEAYRKAWVAGHPYRLVIMDLTIPGGMGGLDAIRQMRSIDPEVKAIVSSGHSNDPAMQSCRDFGFVASIRKPYNLQALQEVLAEASETQAPLDSRKKP